jgi:peptidoglycan hydrolase-like protein with peptidoglycan-binding domain
VTGRPVRKHRRLAMVAGLAAAAVAGAVVTVTVIGGAPAPAAPAVPPVATVRVARTTLVTTVLTEGTLGYASTSPVVNQLAGTFTQIPRPGRRIAAGGTLFRVDDLPVVLMTGRVPAWRPMLPGITGPDVRELERNLIGLGYATGLFSAPGSAFTAATSLAVERWQQAAGLPVNGEIELGRVLFLPGPVLAGAAEVAPGDPAAPGAAPYQVTTATRVVTVPLDPANAPRVTLGERVRIILPSGAVTPGTVSAMGPPSPSPSSNPATPPSADPAAGGSQAPAATTVLTVAPLHPWRTGRGAGVPVQVSLTTQSAAGVLAVPVSALLALQGGGYALEVVGQSGAHRLVAVRTGIFAGSQVQVTGTGITVGTRVVVAQ